MKLNRMRNLALGLVFLGLVIMYFGVFFRTHTEVIATLFLIGTVFCLFSVAIYFRLGTISMRIPQVECSGCHRFTKIWGTEDACMYCGTPVSIVNPSEQR